MFAVLGIAGAVVLFVLFYFLNADNRAWLLLCLIVIFAFQILALIHRALTVGENLIANLRKKD